MPCGEFNARVYVEAIFFLHPLPVFHAQRQAVCPVLPFQAVVHFVVYGVVVLDVASFQDDVYVLPVFFLHGSVQGKACQLPFSCPVCIGVLPCSVVQGRPDGPVSFFLVVTYLGYVIGLFEVGVLFVYLVLSAQVSGPDAVFFFGQSYVSHSSLQIVVVSSPQKDGSGHGCFAPFHHLGFFAPVFDVGIWFGIRVRVWIGVWIRIRIRIGIGVRVRIIFCCRGIEVLALSCFCFVGHGFQSLCRRLGRQAFCDFYCPRQVLFSAFVGFVVQFIRQCVQGFAHQVLVRRFP